jgi:hypothetical protein
MGNLKDQLKQQGLISSFGQPLGSSTLEENCFAAICTVCTACANCCSVACSASCIAMSGC